MAVVRLAGIESGLEAVFEHEQGMLGLEFSTLTKAGSKGRGNDQVAQACGMNVVEATAYPGKRGPDIHTHQFKGQGTNSDHF